MNEDVKTQLITAASDASNAAAANKATAAGFVGLIGGWLLSNDFAVFVGLLVGVGGFAVNWYYSHKRHRREERESRLRSELITAQSKALRNESNGEE